jgi:hypothetical protein
VAALREAAAASAGAAAAATAAAASAELPVRARQTEVRQLGAQLEAAQVAAAEARGAVAAAAFASRRSAGAAAAAGAAPAPAPAPAGAPLSPPVDSPARPFALRGASSPAQQQPGGDPTSALLSRLLADAGQHSGEGGGGGGARAVAPAPAPARGGSPPPLPPHFAAVAPASPPGVFLPRGPPSEDGLSRAEGDFEEDAVADEVELMQRHAFASAEEAREARRDVELMAAQLAVLKEALREAQLSRDRDAELGAAAASPGQPPRDASHALSFLKQAVVAALSARAPEDRKAHIPVIARLLKLSHEDLAKIAAAEEGAGGVLGGILSPLSPGGRVFGLF